MLRPMPIEPVPTETARVARAAFPKGHRYLRLADELDTLFTDELFTTLFPASGQPALAPWRLGLVTILQFAEGLSDRQAADTVRSRIDWKYVLRLELADPGFDASVLSEFRTRLIAGAAESLLFETLLAWCRHRQLVKARGRQRTDSTHILPAVRALNRLEVVGETLRHALDTLAVVAPEWLRAVSPPEWRDRYTRRAEDDRLLTTQTAHAALTLTIGNDGRRLLSAVDHPDAPLWLREGPAVAVLRRVWIQNYWWDGTQLQWREADNIPPAARFISSPDDPEAHYARKHTTQWVGYKVHLTETCEDDRPHLKHATCPAGKTSISWTPAIDNRKNAVIRIKFSTKDCRRCDHVTQCIRSKKRYARRTLTVRPQRQYQALQAARHREATAAFQAEYARRAGIEGTISRETRSMRLRRTRYIGLRRVHLGHILAAAGLNVLRLGEWFLETARAKTRLSPFARLLADGAAA